MVRNISLILLIFTLAAAALAAGEVDPGFNASVHVNQNDAVKVIVTQPDGKHLIAGNFTVINGASRLGIARINADGTIDNSFFPPVFYDINTAALGSTINTIALQPDGKILVGGKFLVAGSNYQSLIRLNSNGSIDTTFNVYQFGVFEVINKILVSASGSIYLGGDILMNRGDGWWNHDIIKLNANGAPDIAFQYEPHSQAVKNLVEQPDGKIVYSDMSDGVFPNIKRINADGTADNSFGIFAQGGGVQRLTAQPDGKILACGNFTAVNGFSYSGVARINANGSIDVNFNTNGVGMNSGGFMLDVAAASDGKIYVGGDFTSYNGVARNKLARLNTDGTLDGSFNNPGVSNTIIREVEALSSGKVLVGGLNTSFQVSPLLASETINRLNADGTVDGTFTTKAGRAGKVREVVQQSDGKILIVGEFTFVNGVARNSMARLNADGSLDTSFVPYFNLAANPIVYSVAIQPDGKILVGMNASPGVRRMNPDGTQDGTFTTIAGTGFNVYDIIVLPNNQILYANNNTVRRLNSNGDNDAAFTPAAFNGTAINKLYLQADGRILTGGDFTQVHGSNRGRIARLNPNGTHDLTFDPPGGANSTVYDIDQQPDGRIILGGAFFSLNGGSQAGVGRLNIDGTLDSTFAQSANVNVLAVKLQPDGKILIGGQFTVVGGLTKAGIARLNSNGSLDSSFTTSALIAVTDIALQSDGKILPGGDFTQINGVSQVGISRLLNAAAPVENLFDFDGDNKADVSVFRPSTNRWYVFKSSDFTVSETTFGIAGDVVAPADFDGDNKTDLAIFRPSSGDWWSLSSINGAQIFAHWGASGDIPRPSDFDGDGRADYVVFRPSNSFWYRISSATGISSNVPFGLAGDKPVSGDFDGDGKSDPAIFRPSTGDWWYQSSINNAQLAVRWGISTDVPAPADFDGDGKTDFAVYRPSTGVWYVINSSNGSFLIMNFGIAEDKPVPADYDGDGKADIAVFRPSTGVWYQMKTTAGFAAQQFGVSTDIPTENAFVP